jgi:hypothetical protein
MCYSLHFLAGLCCPEVGQQQAPVPPGALGEIFVADSGQAFAIDAVQLNGDDTYATSSSNKDVPCFVV